MAKVDYIVKNNVGVTQEKVIMVDGYGQTRQVASPTLFTDVVANETYKADTRRHKDGSDWYPGSNGSSPLSVTGSTHLREIRIKGISVFLTGTITAADAKIRVTDVGDTNTYFEASINQTNSHFDFGEEGLLVKKPDGSDITALADFIIKIYGVTGSNTISVEGWRI